MAALRCRWLPHLRRSCCMTTRTTVLRSLTSAALCSTPSSSLLPVGRTSRDSPAQRHPSFAAFRTSGFSRNARRRLHQTASDATALSNETTMYYMGAIIVVFIGLTYAAVPLYKLICTDTGLDGTPNSAGRDKYDPEVIKPVPGARKIKITFASSLSDSMKWNFVPQTKEISVLPGETALAFYTAENPTDEDVVGLSTYSVVPAKAAQYFNKIQCFCFEEQKLAAKEEVDMPVFFYIDPEFAFDPYMKDVSHITLHYTFFRSRFQ
ncbi:cytochrome c oxidase assembly protein CtaG/Cox11-domain-containing protein [Zopfochytrium polystomum]|nr:cytochrome c oxidase assembly protein CtaG/Cox11-domain-containing protein [Zopfochytrium polystomum]